MNTFIKLTGVSLAATFALAGAPAHAILLEGEASASVDAEPGEVRILAQEEVDTELDTNVDTGTTEQDTPVSDQSEDESVAEDPDSNLEEEEGILILRSEVLAETEGKADGTITIDPVTVTDEAALEDFAREVVVSDEHAERVEVTEDEVSLTYKQEGQLFAFIPVLVDTTVSVDADGSVSVTYPWYSFLTQVNDSDLESAIETNVQTIIGEEVEGEAVLTVEERALILSEVYETMSAELAVESGTETEAGTEVEVQ